MCETECPYFVFIWSSVPGVKTAGIGTLGRTRTPVAVTVPSAPDQTETSKMLPYKEAVSSDASF